MLVEMFISGNDRPFYIRILNLKAQIDDKINKKKMILNFRIMNFSNFDSLLRHNFKGNQTSTINSTCVYIHVIRFFFRAINEQINEFVNI